MGLFLSIIIVLILVIAIAVAAGFLTKAAAHMTVGTDPHQIQAHKYLVAASTIGWISVALVLVAGGFFAYYGSVATLVSGKGQAAVTGILVFVMVVFIVNGVLAAFAAYQLSQGKDYATVNHEDYVRCAVVAGVCLGTVGLIIIIMIAQSIAKRNREKQAKEDYIAREIQKYGVQLRDKKLQQQALNKAIEAGRIIPQEYLNAWAALPK